MEATQDESMQEQENLAGDVMDSLGIDGDSSANESNTSEWNSDRTDPLYVQKRLKQQKRSHEREMRALRAEISAMHSGRNQAQPQDHEEATNPYMSGDAGDIARTIHRAVSDVFQQKELAERKAKEHEQRAHVEKAYQDLHNHLDHMSDKYDDFDDVVRGDTKFTEHMRDAALLLPLKGSGSAGEVLYKLGSNPDKLSRIAELHPLEQARELTALSHALVAGASPESKGNRSQRPMGSVKSNPSVSSNAITDKTSAAEIRQRMRAGKFR